MAPFDDWLLASVNVNLTGIFLAARAVFGQLCPAWGSSRLSRDQTWGYQFDMRVIVGWVPLCCRTCGQIDISPIVQILNDRERTTGVGYRTVTRLCRQRCCGPGVTSAFGQRVPPHKGRVAFIYLFRATDFKVR